MANEKKRILTPDMFDVNESGEVVIKDKDLIGKVKGAKAGEAPGEQGILIGIVIAD